MCQLEEFEAIAISKDASLLELKALERV